MKPGEYPVRYQIIGPNNERIFDESTTLTIPEPQDGTPVPFSIPVFEREIAVDGPSGEYRFLAHFLEGGAAAGGSEKFFVADPADMPAVNKTIYVWGENFELRDKLNALGIPAEFASDSCPKDAYYIVGYGVKDKSAEAFAKLYQKVEEGATVLFLAPEAFKDNDNETAFLPFEGEQKGRIIRPEAWLYHKDDWNKKHPVFNGLPSGKLMDHFFYRDVIPYMLFADQPTPDVVIAGAISTSRDYHAGISVAQYNWGQGKIFLNTLILEPNLGKVPVAEHILRNFLLIQ